MGYQLELRHFTYFLAVAEELHFRKAAEKLFISQPGLSRQIKQMEGILQVQLFVRDKKKVILTPAGHYLKGQAEAIFHQINEAKRQLQLIGEGDKGEIRIGFLGSAMQSVIPNLLLSLKDKYPNIKTSLEERSNMAQVEAVLKDELDIGFVRLSRVPKALGMTTVYRDTFSLVLPENYPMLTRNFEGMHQFANDDFILFSKEYSPFYFETIMSICSDAGFVPKVSHKTVHAHTIFKLVENNMGIAIVPTALKSGFQMRVKFIELRNIDQRALLSAIWKKDNPNPVLKNCMDLLLK
ncbi:LysR family transcriptional regulator [Maribacter polysiphoniae]|uniref:DNA-binding transcriptional LysR family regulator n=1 Tax=Maribacter polysiphoniae TaxID=429344 RepID=A0A316DZ23_9FLAO|nr:LysR family transcriptional regulator [Maribacter polysiphoniae]MBD1259684.1 LysR family transcriptional regulator [Maribacter polysiphoniae]PWK23175.1 DNA-binding transcriptional LysR family regulator [Maribacter polysiphoniae]